MAKTMVDKILEVEQEGRQIVADAREKARVKTSNALEQMKELKSLAAKQAESDAATIVSEAQTEAEKIKTEAGRKAWADGEKISAKDDKNREKAVTAAVEIILN